MLRKIIQVCINLYKYVCFDVSLYSIRNLFKYNSVFTEAFAKESYTWTQIFKVIRIFLFNCY